MITDSTDSTDEAQEAFLGCNPRTFFSSPICAICITNVGNLVFFDDFSRLCWAGEVRHRNDGREAR